MKQLNKCILIVLSTLLFSFVMAPGAQAVEKKTTKSDDYIIINKKKNELAFYHKQKRVRVYKVATGRTRDLTPEGTYKIVKKIVNRPYFSKNIAGGSPHNPLGKRWLGLAVPQRGEQAGLGNVYAIHGNNLKSSIGTYASGGCIRMYNEDIEKSLYNQVKVNTPVFITYSSSSFTSLAKKVGYLKEKHLAKK
ncbi:ErfK/YbiS/YcfS/YnhG family protein [Fictibacillus macauensis ZFHKF-1]|uniref:ErfK/YbiS/YcfS/YnhG family protein n=1 Tax=Fictibacillus macauensis ZFHKF-1 TaxID=1196324 RepID=I8UAQ5_9BACL|nr:L,D-transpeptidase [Fictibacillus macauensis]EIT83995.1 ErfK/YbiS/YcfS/YnhG family protein [Fictibacillus macauensis ZFHKF-1]